MPKFFKYRAWDIYHTQMIQWDELKDIYHFWEYDGFIIMPFIEIQDKKEIDLYLHDIVSIRSDYSGDTYYEKTESEVLWDAPEFYLNSELIDPFWQCLLIGNIYENPELLI